MLDLFSNSDLWIKIVALLTSIIALITAVITLKKSRGEKSELAADSPVKLRSFRAIERSRIWGRLLTACLIGSMLFTAVSVSTAIVGTYMYTEDRSAVLALIAMLGAAMVFYIAFLKRRMQGSVVKF
jgi:putative exporter of polyketide antibiotics